MSDDMANQRGTFKGDISVQKKWLPVRFCRCRSPELAQLLACVVLKIRKAKGDFAKKPGPKTESRQMTFDF